MMRNRSIAIAVGLVLVLAGQDRADAASMTLSDGTEFAFELVRSRGGSKDELGTGVATGKGEGYRVLFDNRQGRFYGYTVKGTSLGKGRFRLELGPLTPEVVQRLTKTFGELEGKPLVGESLAIEYPPPVEVGGDEPILLDLMVNPTTGEKLADVIRVRTASAKVPNTDTLSVAGAVIRIDGKAIPGSGGASGLFLYFWVHDHGRFIVSPEAVDGYAFEPAKLSEDRTTLSFVYGGQSYEWSAREPFRIGTKPASQLWVLADPAFRRNGDWGVGTLTRQDLPR